MLLLELPIRSWQTVLEYLPLALDLLAIRATCTHCRDVVTGNLVEWNSRSRGGAVEGVNPAAICFGEQSELLQLVRRSALESEIPLPMVARFALPASK
jgi:hypothetical protein